MFYNKYITVQSLDSWGYCSVEDEKCPKFSH